MPNLAFRPEEVPESSQTYQETSLSADGEKTPNLTDSGSLGPDDNIAPYVASMSLSDSEESTCSEESSLPENEWIKQVLEMYPDLEKKTHFCPPVHFNRVPFRATVVPGGLTARVKRTCYRFPSRHRHVSSDSDSSSDSEDGEVEEEDQQPAAGRMFLGNPSGLRSVTYYVGDSRSDRAHQKCINALHDIERQTMMVVSHLHFNNYLANTSAEAAEKLPCVPKERVNRECDIIVIHRNRGLLVGEVKAVRNHSPIVRERVYKAIEQLEMQSMVLGCLLKDLPRINMVKAIMLPNLTTSRLRKTLERDPQLAHGLIKCTQSTSMGQAISRCLCREFMQEPQLSAWWENVWHGRQPLQTPGLYERIVSRFCGLASTVTVPPSAQPPALVVRTLGQAVVETGNRFSTLTLTRQQEAMLSRRQTPKHLYLEGPPGVGKTQVLFLDALRRLEEGATIIVAHLTITTASALLMRRELIHYASVNGIDAASRVVCYNFKKKIARDYPLQSHAINDLLDLYGRDKVHFVLDEAPLSRSNGFGARFRRWLEDLRVTLPQASLWLAGTTKSSCLQEQLPWWIWTKTLRQPIRTPPHVRDYLTRYWAWGYTGRLVHSYAVTGLPEPTCGAPVRQMRHCGVPGHQENQLDCLACADAVAGLFRELGVGLPGHPQFRDVWILYEYYCVQSHVGSQPPSRDFMSRLRDHHNFPITEIALPEVSAQDWEEVALASSDVIVLAPHETVLGLQRKVVVALGKALFSACRASSFLCVIDSHGPGGDGRDPKTCSNLLCG